MSMRIECYPLHVSECFARITLENEPVVRGRLSSSLVDCCKAWLGSFYWDQAAACILSLTYDRPGSAFKKLNIRESYADGFL